MLVICRTKQEGGGIDCSTGDNDDISGVALGVTVAPDLDARDFATRRAGFQPGDLRSCQQQRDVRVLQRRVDADHLRI